MSRLQQYQKAKKQPPIIELRAGQYLLDAMFKLRPTRPQPMGGVRPVDWPEVTAFSAGSQRVSEPWELELLIDMAEAYVEGLEAGKNPLSKPPSEWG